MHPDRAFGRDPRDRERNTYYNRSDEAGPRPDLDGRLAGPRGRQRVLSAPSTEGPRYSESFEADRRDYQPSRSSYPSSPAVAIGPYSTRIDRNEGTVRGDTEPSSRDAHIESRPRRDHDEAPKEHEDKSSPTLSAPLPPSPKDTEMRSPPMKANPVTDQVDNATASDNSLTEVPVSTTSKTEASVTQESKRSTIDIPIPTPAVSSRGDIMEVDSELHPITSQEEPSLATPTAKAVPVQEISVKQEDSGQDFEQPVIAKTAVEELEIEKDKQAMVVVPEAVMTKASRSPSMISLPSPELSPSIDDVAPAVDTISQPAKTAAVEFVNHADILAEIDKIDGTIQNYEDLLAQHRVKKEQEIRAASEALLSQADDEVPNDVEQSELESAVEDSAMEVEMRHSGLSNNVNVAFEPSSPVDLVPDKDMEDPGLDIVGSEDIDMSVGEPETGGMERHRQIAQSFSRMDLLGGPVDEDDPFLKRKAAQTRRPQLFDQIYAENNTKAKKYGRVHTAIASSSHPRDGSPHRRHQPPTLQVFESIEDYPCYQENIDNHQHMRDIMLRNMAVKAAALDEKELSLKREYKQHWESWNKKVEKLDKLKEKMATVPAPANAREEDQVVGESNLYTTTRNRRGAYQSDAVRSEAELLEIIQSLENADMRNPDLRASRTAATVPPMILDPKIREKVHYYDQNHRVLDPRKYYHLGAITDIWTEEEREIFTKRYLNYPKQFGKIAAGLEDKNASQCVLFYYRQKKSIGFKEMLSNRGRKRKPAAGKRKEKTAQASSPQPGKKHKGSALIEDIGQANRTKMAKSKELRELQEMSQSWQDPEIELGTRRSRVRSGAAKQGGDGTPGPDETNSNGASPAPSSAISTPVLSASEKRKQRSRNNNNSRSTPKTQPVEDVIEEKKPKLDRSTSAASSSNGRKAVEEEALISVDSPGSSGTGTVVVGKAAMGMEPNSLGAQELASGSVAFNVPENAAASARWTTAEHAKAIEALKKYGRDFEAVAAAVGTKTVDQCRNFCFNYKRKFGVSALDDANSLHAGPNADETEDKEATHAVPAQKGGRGKKARNADTNSIPGTPTTPTVAKDPTAPPGRRRAAKASSNMTPESVKEEPVVSPGVETAPNSEDVETAAEKRRKKRVSSKVDPGAAPVEGAPPASATSFRALYSRDPLSASASPGVQVTSPEAGMAGQQDAMMRRPNFSSYWSRQEKIDFARLLSIHGKDWDKISKAMKTKTLIQVRNHFSNNADKLSADGFVGSEPSGSPMPTLKEETPGGLNDGESTDNNGGFAQNYTSQSESGPKSGYFATPSQAEGIVESSRREEARSVTPPRRITNIGNLLNNDDEEVHVAAEDWFGNSEENNGDRSLEEEREPEVHHHHQYGQQQHRPHHHQHRPSQDARPPTYEIQRQQIGEDEDAETEDELDRRHAGHNGYDSGYRSVPAPSATQRRASETSVPMGYGMGLANERSYYSQPPVHDQRPPQHVQHQHPPTSRAGVLGSPYGGQHYYEGRPSSHPTNSTGYRSPPSSGRSLHPVTSPSQSMPSGPSSAIGQPMHYQHPQPHQRSGSIGHSDMTVPRSQPSPQMSMRARSPLSHQGPYYGGQQLQQQPHAHQGYASSGPYGYPPQQNHLTHVHAPHPRDTAVLQLEAVPETALDLRCIWSIVVATMSGT
ncbi:hypothetical protein BGZ83_003637 [Gryganskiella cystojenkinii]|nr:hypothetical protein BGZ83_003637 [Gryganskiella cystojenkinii]